MSKGKPYFIALNYMHDKLIRTKIEEQYPAQFHTIGELRDNCHALLTALQYDSAEKKMNENIDFSASAMVKGD